MHLRLKVVNEVREVEIEPVVFEGLIQHLLEREARLELRAILHKYIQNSYSCDIIKTRIMNTP